MASASLSPMERTTARSTATPVTAIASTGPQLTQEWGRPRLGGQPGPSGVWLRGGEAGHPIAATPKGSDGLIKDHRTRVRNIQAGCDPRFIKAMTFWSSTHGASSPPHSSVRCGSNNGIREMTAVGWTMAPAQQRAPSPRSRGATKRASSAVITQEHVQGNRSIRGLPARGYTRRFTKNSTEPTGTTLVQSVTPFLLPARKAGKSTDRQRLRRPASTASAIRSPSAAPARTAPAQCASHAVTPARVPEPYASKAPT